MTLTKQRPLLSLLSLLLLAALACSGLSTTESPAPAPDSAAIAAQVLATLEARPDTASVDTVTLESLGVEVNLEVSLTELYKAVNPGVVHVFTLRGNLPLGEGSGFIYDNDGHIITNNHVVENGNNYEVVFADGQRRVAEFVGSDVDSDLAVIRVSDIPPGAVVLPLGDSNTLQVGQLVVAIGNPFGEEGSMSQGIVSGLGRSLTSQRVADGGGRYSLPEVIQTDTAINPGNSGGPLLNLRGEVVGVNSAIRTETGTNSGVGFAIPVNAVHRVAPALIANGEYTYPFLGIASLSNPLSLGQQEELGISRSRGAYITAVTPDGPAEQAGLRAADPATLRGGDLIIGIDGREVNEFTDLTRYLVFEASVGQTVELTILRDNETITLPLTLGARP